MKMAPREIMLGLATGVAVLVALSIAVAKPKLDDIQILMGSKAALQIKMETSRKLIDEKARWDKEYSAVSALMPVFPASKPMDAHWGQTMDTIAVRNNVKIANRKPGKESNEGSGGGDVYEYPIEVTECESDLESMVRFLFDLQNEGAMLDVRQLNLEPRGKGVLRGRFTLYCAYMKEGAGKAQGAPATNGVSSKESK